LPARAATTVEGYARLSRVDRVVTWSRHLERQEPPALAFPVPRLSPANCEDNPCQEFNIDVDLPASRRPWGLQFSIHWPYASDEPSDLDLEVIGPNGSTLGFSAGGDEDTESVFVKQPINGRYRVVVAQYASPELTYTGRVEVEQLPPAQPRRELLPNLTVRPLRHLVLGLTGEAPFGGMFVNGCGADEISERRALRCLRFEQIIANVGKGPMELRYNIGNAAADRRMFQVIYRTDGSKRVRKADTYQPHLTHGHVHYTSFALSRLWRSDAKGRRVGSTPIRQGNKNGFCLIDVENVWFDRKGDAARSYYGDGCNYEAGLSGQDMTHGISVGWGDVYNWFLPDQYIEVSDVPDGYYLIETIADPRNTIVEGAEGDNSRFMRIRMCGDVAEFVTAARSACV
jgi:hypothetical protein